MEYFVLLVVIVVLYHGRATTVHRGEKGNASSTKRTGLKGFEGRETELESKKLLLTQPKRMQDRGGRREREKNRRDHQSHGSCAIG